MKKFTITATTPVADIKVQLALALGSLLAAYYRQPLLFLFFVLLLAYLSWSYCWTRLCCRFVKVEGSLPVEKFFAGELLRWGISFLNELPFPLARCGVSFYLPSELSCAGDFSQEGDLSFTSKTALNPYFYLFSSWKLYTATYTWLPAEEKVLFRAEVKAPRRGVYYLPPPRFFVGDPSGLFRGQLAAGSERQLVVFPVPRKSGELEGLLLPEEENKKKGPGLEDRYDYQGVRDYQLNDPPKNINWYASARTGSLKSNLYQPKIAERCLVVFDTSVRDHPLYSEAVERFYDQGLEEAISTVAGVALFYLEQGLATAFLTNAPLLQWEKKKQKAADEPGVYLKRKRAITALPFGNGPAHAQNILEVCAAIDETSRPQAGDQLALWEKAREMSKNALVYLLCYHQPPAKWEEMLQQEDDRVDNRHGQGHSPEKFYSPQRLGELSSSRVRLLYLDKEGS
ncbi:MAG: DUF58 domain-containing protein [Firmicutes bacterium]|nr:DUF58 domain-containing protein [Bacillota bacterium]